MIKKICSISIILFLTLFMIGCRKHEVISIFPLKNYDQDIFTWIKSSNENYDKPVITNTKNRLDIFYKHYIGASSPWDKNYINEIFRQAKTNEIKAIELDVINTFNNEKKPKSEIGYGVNFRPYSKNWIETITNNINLSQFANMRYNENNRAIAIENLYARALPTNDPYFYSFKIAGQGYPFDNLQISALWAGTPIYILGVSHDRAWSLVVTPDYIGWVKSSGIARTNNSFIKTWANAAQKRLAAITHTKTSIVDTNHVYRFLAYVGAVFPVTDENSNRFKIMIPVADAKQQAVINYAYVGKNDATIIPLTPSPHNFSKIISTLLGRPYGWGNLLFNNDCSSELKSLFTPFGIWLPRHSSEQIYAGKITDLGKLSPAKRIHTLMEQGQAFTTLIYTDNHIILFIGNFPNPNSKEHELMPMTFQDKWGLKPKDHSRRAIIGKSVLFPILERYPEDRSLLSQAAEHHFQISQLETPSNDYEKLEIIDLKQLMYP